jgi:Na+/H+-dicarboxylate symporter
MERLIFAAYASSCNILLGMTMVVDRHSLDNNAMRADGKVPRDTADFVLSTGDVTRLAGAVIVSVPCILLFLVLLKLPSDSTCGWRNSRTVIKVS